MGVYMNELISPLVSRDTESLISHLTSLLKSSQPSVIAIDGKCGSGKSTLAGFLAAHFDAALVHIDDFYLPFDMRTRERLDEPGGNVHYERFHKEIYLPLKERPYPSSLNEPVCTYHIFSCAAGTLTETRTLPSKPLTIIEGSYCMRPEFRDLYDLSIFLDITDSLQQKRLQNRVGPEAMNSFNEIWIPLENRYFDTGISDICSITFLIR